MENKTMLATGQKSYNCQEDSNIPVADNYISFQRHIVSCQEEAKYMVDLREHHIKYKEIHGVDETVWLENGEHQRLHRRLRKEGNCNIDPKTLEEISNKARRRTEKSKEYIRKYSKKRYKENPKCKAYQVAYNRRVTRRIEFCEAIGQNVIFRETVVYNISTGNIVYSVGFRANHGFVLPNIIEGQPK